MASTQSFKTVRCGLQIKKKSAHAVVLMVVEFGGSKLTFVFGKNLIVFKLPPPNKQTSAPYNFDKFFKWVTLAVIKYSSIRAL